jgi:hypothetical protein
MEPVLQQHSFGTPFAKMTQRQKIWWLVRLALCIVTFGMAYPNIQSQD